jgi:NADH-quinone oxidoreductase subunit C
MTNEDMNQETPAAEKEETKAVTDPRLERIVKCIEEFVGEQAIEEAYINEKGGGIPTLVIRSEHWLETAKIVKQNPELSLHYLRSMSGVDYEKYLEVVYHFINLTTKLELCVKVRTDRVHPAVPSLTSLWQTADWNEREIYDLFGIDFPGHPNLTRIMLPDDWEGHPLRKDYEPLDPEV